MTPSYTTPRKYHLKPAWIVDGQPARNASILTAYIIKQCILEEIN